MTEFVISVVLTVAPSLYPQVEDWLYSPLDTPAADVVRIKPPYALVKHHSKGLNPPTELVGPYPTLLLGGLPRTSAQLAGRPMVTECDDVQSVAMSGDWLVSQDRTGRYSIFDLSETPPLSSSDLSLDDVNVHLAEHAVAPVSDADFRTFEELAEKRERRKVTRCGTTLSVIAVGWAAVLVAVMWRRRGG